MWDVQRPPRSEPVCTQMHRNKLQAGDLQRFTQEVSCDATTVIILCDYSRMTNTNNKFMKNRLDVRVDARPRSAHVC